jgi:hypothetical protein
MNGAGFTARERELGDRVAEWLWMLTAAVIAGLCLWSGLPL